MSDVKSIEKAVESLPPAELAEFRQWFAEFDAAAWDRPNPTTLAAIKAAKAGKVTRISIDDL